MRKYLSVTTVAALVSMAGFAHAEQMVASGEAENIDRIENTFSVGDTVLQWSSQNSLGVKLNELKDGEPVRVVYDRNQDGTNDVIDMRTEQ